MPAVHCILCVRLMPAAVLALALLLLRHAIAAQAVRPKNLVTNPNFERVDHSGWPSNWSHATAFRRSTAQHVAGALASLEYHNYDPSITEMVAQRVPDVQPGHQYTLTAEMLAAGLNNTAFGGGATICATWNAPPFFGDYLGSGPAGHTNWTTQQLTFVYPASRPAMSVAVYVRPLVQGPNRTPTGVAYFGNVSLVHNPPPPLRTELLSPLYRGRIDATTTEKIAVRARLHFELQPNETGAVSLVAKVRRRVGAIPMGPAVLAVERAGPFPFALGVSIDERAVDIVFKEPPAKLTPGAYVITVDCLDAQNNTLGTQQLHNLTRLEDTTRASAVSIDHLQRTVVANTGPFFPIGWFFGAGEEMTPGGADFWKFELLSHSPFNTVMPYGESSRTNLDAATTLDMKVVSSLKQAYFGLPSGDGSWPAAITSVEAEGAYLRERILAARNHSALLAWYINDELPQSFLPQIKTHYDLFVALDPDHPTWQVLCEVGHFRDYLGTFDVIGSDPYPIGRPNRGAWGVHQEINDTVVETNAARPVWEVLQAIDWALYNPTMCKSSSGTGNASLCHTPNATEVRSMTWQAIANGANGIFFWEFNDLFRNPDVGFNTSFAYYSRTAQEVLQHAPTLLSDWGTGPRPMLAPTAAQSWLSTRVQWTDAHHDSCVLFAVSDGRGGGLVTFDLSRHFACHQQHGAPATIAVERVMEPDPDKVTATGPQVSSCTFTDRVPNLAAAAWNITLNLAHRPAASRRLR